MPPTVLIVLKQAFHNSKNLNQPAASRLQFLQFKSNKISFRIYSSKKLRELSSSSKKMN